LCVCSCVDCEEYFANSLFLMGEIGGNDYNYPFLLRRSMDEVDTFIPLVVDKIISALKVSDFNLNLANHFSIIHLSLFYNMYKHMVNYTSFIVLRHV